MLKGDQLSDYGFVAGRCQCNDQHIQNESLGTEAYSGTRSRVLRGVYGLGYIM
jgi:hypothetical protein